MNAIGTRVFGVVQVRESAAWRLTEERLIRRVSNLAYANSLFTSLTIVFVLDSPSGRSDNMSSEGGGGHIVLWKARRASL